MKLLLINLCVLFVCVAGQRITTIQLDGVQYFVSRMNPYSPELNYFLAYQYCRSLGLQLASFETKEKAESMTEYLQNAGYSKYDFWTSGNRLGTGMFLWMSTGLPFNATFEYFEDEKDSVLNSGLNPVEINSNTSPQRTARGSGTGLDKGCVILKAPSLRWSPEDCSTIKDFICEQTRCYYYNYGSIPVSSAQGRPITTTSSPITTTQLPPILLDSRPAGKHSIKTEPITLTRSFSNSDFETPSKINDIKVDEKKPTTIKLSTSTSSTTTSLPTTTTTLVTEDSTKDSTESQTEEHTEHVEEQEEEVEEEALEKRLKQISDEVSKFSHMEPTDRDQDLASQSFLSLSDLIKTLRPNDKKPLQIDSDYSNTMKVLGEKLFSDEESRSLKAKHNLEETDPTTL